LSPTPEDDYFLLQDFNKRLFRFIKSMSLSMKLTNEKKKCFGAKPPKHFLVTAGGLSDAR
jgi:hypothetical protein